MDKKFCDLCHKEVIKGAPVFQFSLTSKGILGLPGAGKKGEICYACSDKIVAYLQELKK